MNLRRLDTFLFWTLFFLLLDQISKEIVLRLNLWVSRGPGFFFGLFPGPFYYYSTVLLLLSFALYQILLRSPSNLRGFSLALLSGGTLGNAFDNFYRGAPVDFLNLRWFLPFWPVDLASFSNLADVFIVTGLILYVVSFVNHQSSIANHKSPLI